MLSVKYKPFMLSVIMLNIVTLSVALPNAITIYSNTHSSTAQYILWQSLLKKDTFFLEFI